MEKKLKTLKDGEYHSYDLGKEIIEIGSEGFSLYNKKKHRYVIDGSLWKTEKKVRIGDKYFKVVFKEVQEAREVEDELG